jgi:hypothetical protein
MVQGLGIRVRGLGFGVYGAGFRVEGLPCQSPRPQRSSQSLSESPPARALPPAAARPPVLCARQVPRRVLGRGVFL